MSAASDKARFHLERSVPELREWERRGVFTRAEIAAISRKRSEFEHTLAGRGTSSPAIYARYVAYEMNLDALRKKRVQRLQLKATQFSGQKRIFDILERGTRKHHGDLALWMQYLDFCRREGARKRLQRVMTECVRMFPTKGEVWIWAARYEMDVQGDVTAMRGWMQRALRFCPRDKDLYVEYARQEMLYVAKIAARSRILGIDAAGEGSAQKQIDEEAGPTVDEMDEDVIAVPELEEGDMQVDGKENSAVDQAELRRLEKSPALSGAIPRTVFGSAMKQFKSNDRVAASFWEMFSTFAQTPCAADLMQHVLDTALASNPGSAVLLSCRCRQPLVGLGASAAEFPAALRQTLQLIKEAQTQCSVRADFAEAVAGWMGPMAEDEDLDADLRMVLQSIVRQVSKANA